MGPSKDAALRPPLGEGGTPDRTLKMSLLVFWFLAMGPSELHHHQKGGALTCRQGKC